MKFSVIRIFCFLFLACWLKLGFADDQRYQIELIIFSHITESALRSEYWPLPPPQAASAHAVELSDLHPVPESQWILKNEDQVLRQNDNTILLHFAWQESANDIRQGQIIHLQSKNNLDEETPEVEGNLDINLERYFNLQFNLRFNLALNRITQFNLTNIETANNLSYVSFKLNKGLRMRSNELNYIDHPLYGVLIKIAAL